MSRRMSVKKSTVVKSLAVPLALLASGALVSQASYAAFSATTANPSNTWAAGQVALTDDDGGTSPTTGTAMFTASKLKPGSTGQKCIVVSSTSTVASTLKLYSTAVSTTNGLSTYLNLTVEEGTGGSFAGGCTGFTAAATDFTGTLAGFGTGATAFGSGVGAFALTGTPTETRSYRFTYSLDAAFTWEAQSV